MIDTVLKKNCQYAHGIINIPFVAAAPYVIHSDLEFMTMPENQDALGHT